MMTIPISRRTALALGLSASIPVARAQPAALRLGHFPNITHAQALVAHALSRRGDGFYEKRIGRGIEWFVYNAGPSAVEGLLSNSIDMAFMGPSPAINAFVRSKGEDIRIVAGAAEGGSALVVQPGAGLKAPADFRGKKLATPQLGNTQDVSARTWLLDGGLTVTLHGGDVQVLPTENPDQLTLFRSKQLDAVWTVEPWVTRLVQDAGGEVLVNESDALTTVVVSSVKFLRGNRDLVRRVVAANAELTRWMVANEAEARTLIHDELAAETRTDVKPELIQAALGRIVLTPDVSRPALDRFAENAKRAGFFRTVPDLSALIEQQ